MSHSGEVPASPHLVCAGRAAFLCCQTYFDGCGQMRGIPSQLDHGSLGGVTPTTSFLSGKSS